MRTNPQGAYCPDPYVWYDDAKKFYALICSHERLNLFKSDTMAPDIMFQQLGVALPSNNPSWSWSSGSQRWAPENHKSGDQNFAIFSDEQRRCCV
jgi:hypothetical protein